ncbi:hypothetical protein HID58_087872, partial [Brassica napus]
MANISTILANLKSGRCSSMVEVRLLRFWEARNIKCAGHLMVVDMLILDSKVYPNFRLSDFSLMIRFSNSTEHFRFRNRSELLGLANTNTQLLENLLMQGRESREHSVTPFIADMVGKTYTL